MKAYNLSFVVICFFLMTLFVIGQEINPESLRMTPTNSTVTDTIVIDSTFSFIPDETIPDVGNGSKLSSSSTVVATDLADIRISSSVTQQSEPHLTIDKNHPNVILVSSNTFNGNLGCHTTAIFVSNNNNQSVGGWSTLPAFPRPSPCSAFDPSTAVGADDGDGIGDLFVAAMAPSYTGYDVAKSSDLGGAWSSVSGYNPGTGVVFDKEMIAIDNSPNSPHKNNIYAAWCHLGITGQYHNATFNRSTDGGLTFSTPINLSSQGQYETGNNVQTGPLGQVYVCWAAMGAFFPAININKAIVFTRSLTDGGVSFNVPTVVESFTGIMPDNLAQPQFGGTRVNDFPSMAVDRSCSNYRGRIYIAFNLNVSGKSRIKVKYSTAADQGSVWHNCNTNGLVDAIATDNLVIDQCWMPWIAVDDATGIICVAYLAFDTPGTFLQSTYLAFSNDGGATFDNIKVSGNSPPRSAIVGSAQGYCGDYIGVDAYGGNAYVVWNDKRTNTQNLYCSTVQFATPVNIASVQDLNLNGPYSWTSAQSSVLYEASNNITVCANQEIFTIESGANVTFKAGTSIHFADAIGAKSGSIMHAYIGPTISCTTPYRLSDSVSEKDNSDQSPFELAVFPNPFISNFDLNFILVRSNEMNVKIYDSFGKEVLTIVDNVSMEEGSYNVKVNLHGVNPGIYFLKVWSKNNQEIKKLIKL